jgi:hypothetical protein
MSYEWGAAAGGPLLTDVLGIRVSGWYRQDGGYVDRVDPGSGAIVDANSNRDVSEFFRGALTFAPSANVQISPSFIYHAMHFHDTSSFDPASSDPGNGVFNNTQPVQQPFDDTFKLASLKVAAHWQRADFNLITSYFDRTALAKGLNGNPDGTSEQYGLQQQAYSGEMRLTSLDPDASLGWIGGAFFSHIHSLNPHYGDDGVPSDAVVISQNQFGVFGQFALKITKLLTASAGLRVGHSQYDSSAELPPLFSAQGADTWMTPRFGLSYQVNQDNLVYLTVAKGYGSAGVYPGIDYDPHPYPADALWSYEIGSKHDLLDGRFRLETSIFRIQWNNGPPDFGASFSEQSPVPGRAVSDGFGLTAQALLTEHLKATLGISYSDAHSTETVTLAGQRFALKGESLAGSPWHVAGSIERDFSLQGDLTARVQVQDVFRSSPGPNYLNNPASAYYLAAPTEPSTNVLNIHASVSWPGLTVAASLSNVLGSQPTLSGAGTGATFLIDTAAVTVVPRTVSVSGTWRFDH